jgi:hypothetical protein
MRKAGKGRWGASLFADEPIHALKYSLYSIAFDNPMNGPYNEIEKGESQDNE